MVVMHFKTQEERLKYLKGGFEEIAPVEVTAKAEEEPKEKEPKEEKPKKAKKGKKKDDTVQAE